MNVCGWTFIGAICAQSEVLVAGRPAASAIIQLTQFVYGSL